MDNDNVYSELRRGAREPTNDQDPRMPVNVMCARGGTPFSSVEILAAALIAGSARIHPGTGRPQWHPDCGRHAHYEYLVALRREDQYPLTPPLTPFLTFYKNYEGDVLDASSNDIDAA